MQPKYWAIILLATLAVCASAVYYVVQPNQDFGSIVVYRKIKNIQSQSPTSTNALASDLKDWKTYTNSQYGFEFKYPASDRLIDGSDLAALVIDEQSDPVAICVTDNKKGLSAGQLFTQWKSGKYKFTTKGLFPEDFPPCIDYLNYAKISGKNLAIGDEQMYQVTSMRGNYESICSFITNQKMGLAICLPAQDPKDLSWQGHYNSYNKILSTFKFKK